VVIVFAKFATRNHPREHKYRWGPLQWVLGQCGHTVCISCAWLGLALALAMLGRLGLRGEVIVRCAVGVFAVVAGGILSLDTGLPRKDGGDSDQRPADEQERPGDPPLTC
jgi:hypothetical protein